MKFNSIDVKAGAIAIIIVIITASILILIPKTSASYSYEYTNFDSYEELADFIKDNYQNYSYLPSLYYDSSQGRSSKSTISQTSESNSIGWETNDFSQTNIQVEGVDEPDFVKTDGNYIYVIANSSVYIIRAYPVEEARISSEIIFKEEIQPTNLFINDDYLVTLCIENYPQVEYIKTDSIWNDWSVNTYIKIYDISNRNNPKIYKEIEINGSFFDARMINDYVYVITNEYTYHIYPLLEKDISYIPEIRVNGIDQEIPPTDIYYPDIPGKSNTMTHITSINIKDNKQVSQKIFFSDNTHNLYVSKSNIYLSYTSYEYYDTLIRNTRNSESTYIHKISIKDGKISYESDGEVPGRVLNQFSMDEHDGFLRVATTTGNLWSSETPSQNNIYILDESLSIVSQIEGIAPGEEIYSARFMGEKAYLVTFKKIDPFFTIDLSNPYNPKIIGKLKIPGYSDYLHPYNDEYIIGIGKETVEALESEQEFRNLDFAWYQGLKIALFDVTDFTNPEVSSKIIIGDRGTSSPVLYDHKAFLFDREKELLVIPVSLYEIPQEIKDKYDGYTGGTYGEFTFQGAYVYKLNIEDGFEYIGRITHMDEEDILKIGDYWYWGYYPYQITRCIYINDVLYTISDSMIKMNKLYTLEEENTLQFT
jgi:uncharacterized secreted protein with C-terminal beta-propeller domain